MSRDQKVILLLAIIAAVVSIGLTAAGVNHGIAPPPGWEEPSIR